MPRLNRYDSMLQRARDFRAKVLALYGDGSGLTQAELARTFRVSRQRINQIINIGSKKLPPAKKARP